MLVLSLIGCVRLCGTAEVTTAGTGAELFDVDGDGYAELTEACGTIGGAFGLRRTDYQLGQLVLSGDRDANGRIDFALDTYVLAVADVWFRLDHIEPGTTVGLEALAGSGLHLPTGEFTDLYTVYPLTGGELTFLDERETRGAAAQVALESDAIADVEISWNLEFGGGAQRWEGSDWVQFTNSAPIGDPGAVPPDYVAQ